MLHANGYSDESVNGTLWSDRKKNKQTNLFWSTYVQSEIRIDFYLP